MSRRADAARERIRPAPERATLQLLETGQGAASRHDARPPRRIALVCAGLILLALLVPAGLWMHFQATHVLTRNAMIRAHLSELGVRGEGIIDEILVDAGDQVRAGDLLARLDDRHLQAQREEILASLATLEQQIALQRERLALAKRRAAIGMARAEAQFTGQNAEARAAASRAVEAETNSEARRRLLDDGAISPEQVRMAESEARTARALADAANAAAAGAAAAMRAAELDSESTNLIAAELRVLTARKEQAAARLRQIEANLAATRVLAPADGAIVRRLAQPGMGVETGMPILSMWLQERTWVEAWVPEEKLGGVAPGTPVSVSFPALPGERFAGTITHVGLATDFEMPIDYLPQSREARMRPTPRIGVAIRLDRLPDLLRPGMSATVDIPLDEENLPLDGVALFGG